ncbi:PTS sugar transporter subunit IIC [Collinsella provencensis]|uniref:PTS sugar transporter subunit IIC n=1 Tax=Collinsella provencensis TaxID=1937461 RepID=UPI000C824163|nr:PTS sugar transporter subunit IIC [Collinsella provencensis]
MSAATAGFLCGLVYFAVYFIDNAFMSWDCITRPIVVAPLIGLVLGDPFTGVIMGASLEAIFMGISAIGGSIPSDAISGSVVAVAYAIMTGGGQSAIEAGLALAMAIGTVMGAVNSLVRVLRGSLAPYYEKLAAECRPVKFFVMNLLILGVTTLPVASIVGIGVGAGVDVLQAALDSCPAWVMSGIAAAGSMMTAVGFGILLSMIWSPSIAVFFFVGFVLTKSLALPSIAVAVIGAAIALFYFFIEKDIIDAKRVGGSSEGAPQMAVPANSDEDFFA